MAVVAVAALGLALALAGCANPNLIGVQDYGSVPGRVFDATTNQPIANAIVSVGSLVTGHTDGTGAFNLVNVPVGTQLVNVTANGYVSPPPISVLVVKDMPVDPPLMIGLTKAGS